MTPEAAPGADAAPPLPRGTIRVGGIQFAGRRGRKDENAATAERLIREAASWGAQIVLTPEVVLSGFVGGEAERALAEPIPGPLTDRFGRLARDLDVFILLGMSEARGGELFNATAALGPDGTVMGVMRKVHINRFEVPGGWTNGDAFPVWTFTTATGAMRAGVMICYDSEVPESARLLMLQGADCLFNPVACRGPTEEVRRCLLRPRAFENECYLFMVNHAAPAQNGHSFVVDYRGEIVYEAGTGEEVFTKALDLDALRQYREQSWYAMKHRRPELYGLLCDPRGQKHPPDWRRRGREEPA